MKHFAAAFGLGVLSVGALSAGERSWRGVVQLGGVDSLEPDGEVAGVVQHRLAGTSVADDHGDPETLLENLNAAEAEAGRLRDQLKTILAEALAR